MMALLSESNPICGTCKRSLDGPKRPDGSLPTCHHCQVEEWRRDALVASLTSTCRNCGEEFSSRRRTFCSHRCWAEFQADQQFAFAQEAAAQLDLGAATGYRQRLYAYLAERDGGECYLCGELVEVGTKDTMRRASVDHIIPQSRGGGHDLHNFALVHGSCNSRRGNNPNLTDEQWRRLSRLLARLPDPDGEY